MYNDLLKLLDIDIESVRSSHKSSASSQADHHSRRHRFRKVMPVTSMRHSSLDMRLFIISNISYKSILFFFQRN